MYKLDPAVVDDEAVFRDVAAYRPEPTRTLLLALEQRVANAYSRYLTSLPLALPFGLELTVEEADALRSNYRLTYAPRRLSWLRRAILTAALRGRCPYCDSATATTLDHYLPEATYKEFSIFSRNLLPACHRCNNVRGEAFTGSRGELIWHAYLDELPEEPVLFAELRPADTSVTARFTIQNPHGADEFLVGKLRLLFDALRLGDYFGLEAASMLYDLAPALTRLWTLGESRAVQAQLVQLAADTEARRGRNTWMAAVSVALADVDDFSAACFNDLVRLGVI